MFERDSLFSWIDFDFFFFFFCLLFFFLLLCGGKGDRLGFWPLSRALGLLVQGPRTRARGQASHHHHILLIFVEQLSSAIMLTMIW